MYYSRIASIHPEFPKEFKMWIENDKSAFIFSPIDLNDRYNKYRKVSPIKEEKLNIDTDYNEIVNDLLRMNPHLNEESSVASLLNLIERGL